MKIRLPFAGAFFLLLLIAAYAGLTSLQVDVYANDKVLHFLTFFLLTLAFYWVLDTSRRRTIHLTVVVCTLGLGLGSEVLQGFLPNGHEFDLYDIIANVLGSLAGLGLCSLYHKRMLERKRQRRAYNGLSGQDPDEGDLELGEGFGGSLQEGIIDGAGVERPRTATLEEEADNRDENAEDVWDKDDIGAKVTVEAEGRLTETSNGGQLDAKGRSE